MRVCSEIVEVRTHGPMKLFDVTEPLLEAVSRCGVSEGVAWLSVKGATPALILCEESECGEIVEAVTRLIPFTGWRHGNAYAHLASTVLSTSIPIAIEGSRPIIPPGYRIKLLETRSVYNHRRQIVIQIHGR